MLSSEEAVQSRLCGASRQQLRHGLTVFINRFLLLIALYFALFCLLTYPLITSFNTHFFTDQGDGLQNVWNIWWINKALTQLHQVPWYTSYLHFPYGTSLVAQTLNPFNGFSTIPLLRFLTLVQAHNVVVVFSFVIAGLNAFYLAHYLTGAYWSSFIAGCVFAFSPYHFAHAQGHLQLVSLEWIPLFILCWLALWERPSLRLGVAAAAGLFLVILCDYYYFFYCVLTGAIIALYHVIRYRNPFLPFRIPYRWPLMMFLIVTCLTSGPLVLALLRLSRTDPLTGQHAAEDFSLDLLGLFIPGGHWRFASLTEGYWSKTGSIHESSVYLGIAPLVMMGYVLFTRETLPRLHKPLWYVVMLFFTMLSLGPVLHLWGKPITLSTTPTPYVLLERIFPPLELSGVPVRMVVMATLCAAILVAVGFNSLSQRSTFTRCLAVGLLVILTVEYLPSPVPTTRLTTPGWVSALRAQPDHDAIIDMASSVNLALYYQTLHQRPMAFGYISRTPASVLRNDNELATVLQDMQYAELYSRYHIGYLVSSSPLPQLPSLVPPITYQADGIIVYNLAANSGRTAVTQDLVQRHRDQALGELLPTQTIGQTFTATSDGLQGVAVLTATYYRKLRGPLIVHIQEVGTGQDLITLSTDLSTLEDNNWRVFDFPAISNSAGKRYYIFWEAPGATPGQAIGFWASAGDAYADGTAILDQKPVNADLALQLYYEGR